MALIKALGIKGSFFRLLTEDADFFLAFDVDGKVVQLTTMSSRSSGRDFGQVDIDPFVLEGFVDIAVSVLGDEGGEF